MFYSNVINDQYLFRALDYQRLLTAFILILLLTFVIYCQPTVSQTNNETLTIDEIKDAEIFTFGKDIIIKKEVKGVLVFGGNVIVEGRVEGDVATIGGSVIQKEKGFIGGDVIVFGGKYQHEKSEPLRNTGRETIMYAGYEEELRNMTQNPIQIFSPSLTWSFFGQRLVSIFFWFLIGLAIVTIAPGAISRATTRFHLSLTTVIGLGMICFILLTVGVIIGFSILPAHISGIIGLMATFLIFLAYVFGRVTLQVSAGKWLQKLFVPEKYRSESLSIFLGAVSLTLLLSIPYLWTLTVLLLFAASLGLVVTVRSNSSWQRI